MGLRFIGTAATRRPIRTKIEFSGRSESPSEFSADPVPTSVVDPYRVASPIVNHYRAAAAADQKVAALALRSETKARDVFDLDLLFRRYGRDFMRPLSSEHAEQAAQKGSTVTYDNFRSEVLAFLDPDLAEIYSKAQWEVLHDGVIATLRELAAARDSGG